MKIFFIFLIIFYSSYSAALLAKIQDRKSIIHENFLDIQVGYFPSYTNSFMSDGISFLLLYESISTKKINHGYYFTLLNTFKKRLNTNSSSGSFSIGVFLNYPTCIKNNLIIFRAGAGVGYPTYTLNFLNMFMVEYIYPVNDNLSFTFSILQEIVRFNFILPIQLNLGIRF